MSAIACCVVVVALLGFIVGQETSPNALDRRIGRSVLAGPDGWLRSVASELTFLASGPAVMILTLALAAWVWRRFEDRRLAWICLASPALAIVTELALKVVVSRPPPEEIIPPGERGASLTAPLPFLPHYSFPSGHAAGSAALAVVAVAVVFARTDDVRARTTAVTAAGILVVVLAATRVILGVHWFTDVIAGVLTGSAVALAVLCVSWRRQHVRTPERTHRP